MTSHRRGCVVGVRWIPATGSPGGTAISGYAARRRPGPGPTRLRSGRPANRASTGARGGSAAVAVGSQVKRSAAVRSAVASTSRPATAPSAAISGGRACSGTRPTSPGLSGIAGAGVADRQRHGWPARCGTGRAGAEPGRTRFGHPHAGRRVGDHVQRAECDDSAGAGGRRRGELGSPGAPAPDASSGIHTSAPPATAAVAARPSATTTSRRLMRRPRTRARRSLAPGVPWLRRDPAPPPRPPPPRPRRAPPGRPRQRGPPPHPPPGAMRPGHIELLFHRLLRTCGGSVTVRTP